MQAKRRAGILPATLSQQARPATLSQLLVSPALQMMIYEKMGCSRLMRLRTRRRGN